ncbi:nucleotidyl transferase AbiEii/AbiGii toxin family protein [Streptosporangium sp. NPDC000396]|uniref:nucleotidyl transferase AbiEii/AbiGii toxin family protein n=1 Tax=Streptosporangium sp. NPDC000396 TaxID=3366185 RepID=UPI0036CF6328
MLSLIADAPWSENLMLRGSMVMTAWAGSEAREPADLDFVVLSEPAVPVDSLDPYPYVDRIDVIQQWPEAAAGAARYEIWKDGEEEFETRGLRAIVPPEGFRWDRDPGPADPFPSYDDLLDLVRRQPEAAPGVVLRADSARRDLTWAYAYSGYGAGGLRIIIPWQAEGLPSGEAQLDFALDEKLPQPPVWTMMSRGDGGAPPIVRTASRELSLAWKLLWLHADGAAGGRSQCKDLYDAVLLAEDDRTRLSPQLLRKVLHHSPTSAGTSGFHLNSVRFGEADWAAFRAEHPGVRGTAQDWFHRLVTALTPVSQSACLDGRPRERVESPASDDAVNRDRHC